MIKNTAEKMKEKNNLLKISAFACYVLLMLWLLFGQRAAWVNRSVFDSTKGYFEQVSANAVFAPFRTTAGFVKDLFSGNFQAAKQAVINLGGNVIMFIPLGFFLPCVFRKINTAGKCLLWTAIIILAVEIIQLFTLLGFCDVDDFVFNVFGAMTGYGIYKILTYKCKKTTSKTAE